MIQIDKFSLVAKYEDKQRVSNVGYATDYLGCKTDITNHSQLKNHSGFVGSFPFPFDGVFHEFIEYVGCCYSIDNSSDEFTVVELGAGTGIWSVRASLLAKRKGCKVNALCVEADKNKIEWIKNNFRVNNLDVNLEVIDKAVTINGKDVQFPKIQDSSWDYGAKIGDNKGKKDYRGFELEFERIKSIKFKDILNKYNSIDLLHIDVQGVEFDLVSDQINLMSKKVRNVVIGTHSRKIEGDLFKLFYENKWELLDEQSCHFKYNLETPTLEGMVVTDGTQIWINKLEI